MKRLWLELFDGEFVTATNAALCQPKQALHKPTSDGHDRTRRLWEKNHRREVFLEEALVVGGGQRRYRRAGIDAVARGHERETLRGQHRGEPAP